MDDLYPWTLDLKVFRDDLGGQLTSDSMLLDVLSQFSDEYTFLKAIGAILPSLVEFYQWLHTDLAYMVTVAKAGTVTIQEVVLRATRGYSNELKQHYVELHEKVQGNGLVCICTSHIYIELMQWATMNLLRSAQLFVLEDVEVKMPLSESVKRHHCCTSCLMKNRKEREMIAYLL